MWYKANQKGYCCGGNIKNGIAFCTNKLDIREKELQHIIQTDLKELFQSFQDNAIMASIINKLQTKKRQIQNELTTTEIEIDFLKEKRLDYI
ncbi:hypothetical protein M3215_08110 [Bacillus cytotoxicus]|uniref:Uncharacterized protein n=1 Tax=Bacillus cytotoxicus TaxID=580165 RepID=A0ACC6A7B4_9BACI|nr:hypothetical protein [Bacillus cytotoxicus]